MKIRHLCAVIIRLAALSAMALSAYAGETNNVPSSDSTFDSAAGSFGHYTLSYHVQFIERQRPKYELTMPEKYSVDLVRHSWKITEGIVPLNMDPMETSSERELEIEEHRRLEIRGDGTQKGDIFVSEADGLGFNLPTISDPEAALYLKPSHNSVKIQYSFSFEHYPFENLFK